MNIIRQHDWAGLGGGGTQSILLVSSPPGLQKYRPVLPGAAASLPAITVTITTTNTTAYQSRRDIGKDRA